MDDIVSDSYYFGIDATLLEIENIDINIKVSEKKEELIVSCHAKTSEKTGLVGWVIKEVIKAEISKATADVELSLINI